MKISPMAPMLFACLVPGTAVAQELATETRVEDVVVVGDTQRAARAFVDEVGRAPAGARLARWNAAPCVGVLGLRSDAAQPINDRVADVALALGVEVGEPGCLPNVIVIFSSEADETAEALVRRDRDRFRPGIGNSNAGLAALDRFRTSDAPVRWWHTSAPVFADSGELAVRYRGGTPPGADALARGGAASDSAIRGASRLRSGVRHDLNSITIIVDMERVEGVAWPALIDYLTMIAMAQIDPEADMSGRDTILNLFGDDEVVLGLTAWDEAYLTGLYSADQDSPTARAQEGEIVRRMQDGRRDAAADGD